MNKIYIGFLKVDAIGHIWSNPLNIAPIIKNRKVILFYNLKYVCNKRSVTILEDTLPSNYYLVSYNNFFDKILRLIIELALHLPFSLFLKKFDVSQVHVDSSMKRYGSKYCFHKFDDQLKICYSRSISSRKQIFKNLLNKYKINYKSYILFFLRDEQYWGKEKLNQIRNSNIENFLPLIKLFIENQITVIRVGRSNISRKDYFRSEYYFDISWFDKDPELYEDILFANSKMILGSNSGIIQYQKLENNPMLICNWIPPGIRPFYKNTLYLCKHFYYKGREIRPVNLNDALLLNEDIRDFNNKGIEVLENKSDLLINSAKELIDFNNQKILNSNFEDSKDNSYDSIIKYIYGGNSRLTKSYIDHINKLDS
tara:strand:+ start:13690 stop:14796 length:1107 start_codon:yes stop_codon:yes gene_type:complete